MHNVNECNKLPLCKYKYVWEHKIMLSFLNCSHCKNKMKIYKVAKTNLFLTVYQTTSLTRPHILIYSLLYLTRTILSALHGHLYVRTMRQSLDGIGIWGGNAICLLSWTNSSFRFPLIIIMHVSLLKWETITVSSFSDKRGGDGPPPVIWEYLLLLASFFLASLWRSIHFFFICGMDVPSMLHELTLQKKMAVRI